MRTYLLDKFLEDKALRREELRLAIIDKTKDILKEASSLFDFREAYLFGTITKPYRFHEDSDVDIGFVGLKDEHFFSILAYISRNLQRDVDILQLENHRLKDKIMREGIPWKRSD